MNFQTFIPELDAKILAFSFSLLNETENNIKTKAFFYENQATTYVTQKVKQYLDQLQLKGSLKTVYQIELMNFFTTKLKEIFRRYTLFKCY